MDFFQDFQALECLGHGGFGSVVKVMDKIANMEYAIKLIPTRSASAHEVVREVETLAKMSSIEGVIKYHHSWYQSFDTPEQFAKFRQALESRVSRSVHFSDCLSSGSSDLGLTSVSTMLFIKMDYFQGSNLKEWLRSLRSATGLQCSAGLQPWLFSQILLVFYKILQTVQRIHSAGILHRDLKPENILLQPPCEICICDFGLSKCITDYTQSGQKAPEGQHTRDIGTRAYLAPELLQGQPHSFQSDAFALGLVFLEMLTVYGEDTESEKFRIFECHKNGDVHDKAAEFQRETALISKLICKDPSRRCTITVALDDGLFNSTPFACNICNIYNIYGINCLEQHLKGIKHEKMVGHFVAGTPGQPHPVKTASKKGQVPQKGPTQRQTKADGDTQRWVAEGRDVRVDIVRVQAEVEYLTVRMDRMESKLDQILAALQAKP